MVKPPFMKYKILKYEPEIKHVVSALHMHVHGILTLSQMTAVRLFQIQSVCRQQFKI